MLCVFDLRPSKCIEVCFVAPKMVCLSNALCALTCSGAGAVLGMRSRAVPSVRPDLGCLFSLFRRAELDPFLLTLSSIFALCVKLCYEVHERFGYVL